MADKLVVSPNECAGHSAGTKVGPGEYNGEPGYTPRTKSPNAVPEKTYEGQRPFNDVASANLGTFATTPAKPPYGDKKG